MRGPTAILLLSCHDRKGVVAAVSDFIYSRNGNIVHADQYTNSEKRIFFMRIEWELRGFRVPREGLPEALKPLTKKFGMTWDLAFSDYIPKIAIFVSKLGHCLQDLLIRHSLGEFQAEIPLVISNHPDLKSLAEDYGAKYLVHPITHENKVAQEEKELNVLMEHQIDLIVLARYMQILGDEFISKHRNRIINIHHSFLPAFPRGSPYQQAYERGVKLIGATAHYATAEVDQGQIIAQDVVRVNHRDTVDDFIRKGRDIEKLVLSQAVRLHLQNRILTHENRTVVFD